MITLKAGSRDYMYATWNVGVKSLFLHFIMGLFFSCIVSCCEP